MSGVGKQQGQSQLLPWVPTDNLESDNNAETETKTCTQSNRKEEQTRPGAADQLDYRRKIQQAAFKMYLVCKEVAIVLFLGFAYAALTNDPPKISRSPPALPFFPKDSIISDWYRGQLHAAIDSVRQSDIAFMMYYAPWDAESQAVRREFDMAARYFNHQISFGAINCWHPGSECRRQYHKAYSWPVLIAYVTHGNGIQYRGPRTAAHMVKFLMGLSRPFIRLTPDLHMHSLLAKYDAVVVGCVDASPGSFDYSVLYATALRFVEKDPFQEVAFAVFTGPESDCFSAFAPSLSLHMWNETLWYPTNLPWETEALLTWIFKNLHQVNMWITPTGMKSMALSAFVESGPALILFTPRNPLAPFIDYYDLLHEIGLEYYNCKDGHNVMLNSLLINAKRIENYLKHIHLLNACQLKSKGDEAKMFPSVITYSVPIKWANNSHCLSTTNILKDTCLQCDLLKEHSKCNCFKSKDYINSESYKKEFLFDEFDDARLPKNLQKQWKKEKCRLMNIAESVFPSLFSDSIINAHNPEDVRNTAPTNITGLACKMNISLSLIALDSLEYYNFAERLGIDLSTKKDRTTAVIINEKLETHHIMEKPLNDQTLREFISNFTVNGLRRAFRTLTSIKQKHTHVYPYQKNCSRRSSSEPCLLELNTNTFLPIAMKKDKAVMVLYYSKQCSFCNGISYALLTIAKIFSSINNLWFTRIDGDLNILPWEYTMDDYPTILLFPSERKSESRTFPRSMPIIVPNLISFMLANLDQSLKLNAMWVLCNQTKFAGERQSCISSVRAENLSIIDYTLRKWRTADVSIKAKLLYKLQQLRNLNLLLAHSPWNIEEIQKCMSKLHLASFKDLPATNLKIKNKKDGRLGDEL